LPIFYADGVMEVSHHAFSYGPTTDFPCSYWSRFALSDPVLHNPV
jgi:hypothetical protein